MLRALDKWLPGYLAALLRRPRGHVGTRHLFFCVADHYEPSGRGVPPAAARVMVDRWVEDYPRVVAPFRDSQGRRPIHSFFYPAEEYDEDCVSRLEALCRDGHAEVEVHLHHRHDTPAGFKATLEAFRDRLRTQHGFLGSDRAGRVRYGFIHGNWSLCNSRPDGDWCGVNEELGILRGTGCYADFTFPSAPSPTQPRTVNALYYARDRAGLPRGHDDGVVAAVERPAAAGDEDRLLLVQGPLALNWGRRKWGLLPRVENSELAGVNPPTAQRARVWAAQQIHVQGRGDWIFVKLHTHGAVAANAEVLLGAPMAALHEALQSEYNDGERWRLHYVSARELVNAVHAAEHGLTDPATARDFAFLPPPCRKHA